MSAAVEPVEKVWTQAEGYAVARGRDNERSAWSDVPLSSSEMGLHSEHHRQLRSRGGKHRPSNIVSLGGDGTVSEHGWVHAHPTLATILGYMVHSWDDPAEVPIFRNAPFGAGYGWYLQDDDGQLVPCGPPTDDYALEQISEALEEFERLRIQYRRAADPRHL
ncbi:hypothetical protein MUN78_07085 [Leucobacter allii]|uniref:Uncharacterized protein n=1 Tax=Leucobacter allii TaxID=2932247 RepID=A0ABY4FQP1_9MICO|nr:hypothetical protein [Leucobacter allii]UOQ58581.1 hypothetical protein MUN78_07085 [Leucobacter allii]